MRLERVVEAEDWYELQGVSFLDEEGRDDALAAFQALLSSTRTGILYVRCDEVMTEFMGQVFRTPDVRFFVRCDSRPVSFAARPCENPMRKRPKVVGEAPKHVVTEKGLARVYVAYRYPSVLPEAFLYSVFGLADEICLKWYRINPDRLISTAESVAMRRKGFAERHTVENLVQIVDRIRGGSDVFEFYLYFTIFASTPGKLDEKGDLLAKRLKLYGVEVEAPYFWQKVLYDFRERYFLFSLTKTYADGISMRCLFPLIKENLAENDGVFLGFSGTGDPVVINPFRRLNYLFLVLGETGSGKSMTTKVFLSRLHARTGIPVYGVDPESEYVRVSHVFGSSAVDISEDEPVGLDPIRIGVDRGLAAEILAEIYEVPREFRPRLRKELYSSTAKSLAEFIERGCSKEIAQYLEPATVPPDSYIFEGKPPDVSRPLIFGMRGVRSRHVKTLVSALAAAYFASKVGESVLFVDEGWLFIRTPRIMAVFENIARRGRKYGMLFFFVTQRVEDVASTPEGRTLLEQAATAVLLRQEREGVELLKNIYKLSDGEASILTSAHPGEGILKVEDVKIVLRVAVTDEEMEMFSTTPFAGER